MCIAVLGIVVDICVACLVIAENGLVVEGIQKDHSGTSLGLFLGFIQNCIPHPADSRWSDLEKRDGARMEASLALRGQCHNEGRKPTFTRWDDDEFKKPL